MADSEPEKDPAPFITITLDTGEREFRSPQELTAWATNERNFFDWMAAGARLEPNAAAAWNATKLWVDIVTQFIAQYHQQQQNAKQVETLINNLRTQLGQHLQKGQLLTSTNPIAAFGKRLSSDEDPVVACYATIVLLGLTASLTVPKALLGAYFAFQYKQGSQLAIESHMDSLDAIATDWNARFANMHRELREDSSILLNRLADLREQFAATTSEIGTEKEEQKATFRSFLEKSEKTLSDVTQTYDQKMALQASVSYWTDKRTHHAAAIRWVGLVTLLLAFATAGVFVYAAHMLLQTTVADVQLWRLGVVLAISTFGIWITRLSAKIFISNLHLRTDADERVTMIQTYLALLREGAGPKDDERQLILQTLFRPSTTGFIKDDGPASFHEFINNALTKR